MDINLLFTGALRGVGYTVTLGLALIASAITTIVWMGTWLAQQERLDFSILFIATMVMLSAAGMVICGCFVLCSLLPRRM